MSYNRSRFPDFSKSVGLVQAGNSEFIPSYTVKVAWMIAVVDGVKNYVALLDVMYALGIIHNQGSVVWAQKTRLRVRIDDYSSNQTCNWMNLYHNPSG